MEKIIELINNNLTLNDMAKTFKISNNNVNKRIMLLENKGYLIEKILHDSGDISYNNVDKKTTHTIKLALNDQNHFKALVTSDTHIGNVHDNISYLDKIYNYAIDKNIHIIFNCGDLIEGDTNRTHQNINYVNKQFNKLINKYPYDKHILNIVCLGNHDLSMSYYGRDLKTALENERSDFITTGYGIGLINIEDDQFILKHHLNNTEHCIMQNHIILKGHSHKHKVKISPHQTEIYIPTLSDIFYCEQKRPGLIEIELELSNGKIRKWHFSHLLMPSLEIIGEFSLDTKGKFPNVQTEESLFPKLVKKIN